MTVLQIALTLALLVAGALLVRTVRNLSKVRPGYDTENILAMTVTSGTARPLEGVPHPGVGASCRAAGRQTCRLCLGPPADWE